MPIQDGCLICPEFADSDGRDQAIDHGGWATPPGPAF